MAGTEESSKQNRKYMTSFSNVSQEEAESILGFKFHKFCNNQLPVEQFITKTAPEQLKKEIFKRLVDCVNAEGFPEAVIASMNVAVVADFVGLILVTLIAYYNDTMHRNVLKLSREKQIINKDEEVSENMEFIIMQNISFMNTRYVLVVEANRDSLGTGLPQLLLTLKSMWEINNDQKLVYGFVTTAIHWQLVTYDGQTWKLSEPSTVLFANMKQQEDRWLKNNTQILDVIYSIFSSI